MIDINNLNSGNSNLYLQRKTSGDFGYNLKEEKQEVERITMEVKSELAAKWKKAYINAEIFPSKIAAMHPEVVDFLLSLSLVSVYDNIAKQAGLDMRGRNELPQVVWEIAQTKNWNGLGQLLRSKIAVTPDKQTLIANLLEQNIIEKIRILSEKPIVKKVPHESMQRKEVQLALSAALQQYPNLGEQAITSNLLKLRYFPTPVRPSIKNWITDFHDNMGAGKHSPLDRANYLFHSDNGKKVTPVERQKLATLFKSLEEKIPLKIDVGRQAIIFENNNQRSTTSDQQPAINNQQQFSADQKLFRQPAQDSEQQDVFQRYVSQENKQRRAGFSPNFANFEQMQSIRGGAVQNIQDENYFRSARQSSESDNYFKNFASAGKEKTLQQNIVPREGAVSFSSPQKFAVEQQTEPKKAESITGNEKMGNVSSQVHYNKQYFQPKSQWHFAPTISADDSAATSKDSNVSKISSNIVNLKE